METEWFESGAYQFVLLLVADGIHRVVHLIVDLLHLPVLVFSQLLLPLLVTLHEVIKGAPLLKRLLKSWSTDLGQGEIEYCRGGDGLPAGVLVGGTVVVVLWFSGEPGDGGMQV